jgi:hypothetical protein
MLTVRVQSFYLLWKVSGLATLAWNCITGGRHQLLGLGSGKERFSFPTGNLVYYIRRAQGIEHKLQRCSWVDTMDELHRLWITA